MTSLAKEFCQEMLAREVLRFGDFTLKSGRQTPYFFQFGEMFKNGRDLSTLGDFYARAILELNIEDSFDVLYGAAYKGIPIAVATSIALHGHGVLKDASFNRKEMKAHGEGGWLIGAGLAHKKVLILDDVITDGEQKLEAARLIESAGGEVKGILIGLDRAEASLDSIDGLPQFQISDSGSSVPLYSIAHFDDVVALLRDSDGFDESIVQSMLDYQTSIMDDNA